MRRFVIGRGRNFLNRSHQQNLLSSSSSHCQSRFLSSTSVIDSPSSSSMAPTSSPAITVDSLNPKVSTFDHLPFISAVSASGFLYFLSPFN